MLIETRKPTPEEKIAHSTSPSRRSATAPAPRRIAASAEPITHIMSAQPTSPERCTRVRCMFSLRTRWGRAGPSRSRSTSIRLTAPLPGSGPSSTPSGVLVSALMAALVNVTRRVHSAESAAGESRSAPTKTISPTKASVAPAKTRNMRRETRHANTEPVTQSARSPVRVCVSSTPMTTSVAHTSQKSRSSRRSAQDSSTSTSGMPSTR